MKRLVLLLALAGCGTAEVAEAPKQEAPEPPHVVAYTGDSVTIRKWSSLDGEEAAADAATICGKTGKRAELIGSGQASEPTYRPYAGIYGGSAYRYEEDFSFACV